MSEIIEGFEPSNKIKLLPCPFCGGEAVVYDDDYNHYAIGCKLCCDVTPITTWEDTEEKAVAIWNTRKPMERIVERLEDIKKVNPLGRIGHPKVVRSETIRVVNKAIEICKEEGGIDVF